MLRISIILFTCISNLSFAQGDDYADYLLENNKYTAELVNFLSVEDKESLALGLEEKNLSSLNSQLNKLQKDISQLDSQLQSQKELLAGYKDKQINKDQLLAQYKQQKNQNSSRIQSLNTQINGVQSSLSNINSQISLAENDRRIIVNNINTQERLAQLAQQKINQLEWDIRDIEREINRNQNQIQNLRAQNQKLKSDAQQTQDPNEKQQLLSQVQQNQNRIERLRNENQRLESQNSVKKSDINFQRSEYNAAQSQISSLRIRLNGKENELRNLFQTKNQFDSEIAGYNQEIATLTRRNQQLDRQISELNNLPQLIAQTEQEISTTTQQKQLKSAELINGQKSFDGLTASYKLKKDNFDQMKSQVLVSETDQDEWIKNILSLPLEDSTVDESTQNPELTTLIVSETLNTNKDWVVFKAKSQLLDQEICAAGTESLDKTTGAQAELLVVKILNQDGSYSSPFIVSSKAMMSQPLRSGSFKTDKGSTLTLPILQGTQASEKNLVSRYSDQQKAIGWLKAHNSVRVEYKLANSSETLVFSLRGSSAMINEMLKTCSN